MECESQRNDILELNSQNHAAYIRFLFFSSCDILNSIFLHQSFLNGLITGVVQP